MTPQERYRKKHPEKVKASQSKYVKNNKSKVKASLKKTRNTSAYKIKQRNYMLQKTYGISKERYDELLAEQGGVCFICRNPERRLYKGKPTNLVVDHNHQTGEIRRILCHGCNAAIGLLEENPDRMRHMADYIETFNKRSDDGRA
jgi:hypothetical protein